MLGLILGFVYSILSEYSKLQKQIHDFYLKKVFRSVFSQYLAKIKQILDIAAFNSSGEAAFVYKVERLRFIIGNSVLNRSSIHKDEIEKLLVCDELKEFLKRYNAITEEIHEELMVLRELEKKLNHIVDDIGDSRE